jgi:hypothetical protein
MDSEAHQKPLPPPARTHASNLSIDYSMLVGFEVLTAVFMNSTILWHITPCRPLKVNRHFGARYRLHFRVKG